MIAFNHMILRSYVHIRLFLNFTVAAASLTLLKYTKPQKNQDLNTLLPSSPCSELYKSLFLKAQPRQAIYFYI